MRELKVLHLASFSGNVGDNANHAGFYDALKETSSFSFDFHHLEIREFYWGQRYFDLDFVNYANTFDLLIIGGGNYFELWVDDSPTGTSIMIEPELFKLIMIPVIFNGLGVDPGQGASKTARDKFQRFLDVILSNGKNYVSVRNDGAVENLTKYFGSSYSERIHWTPDAGCNVSADMNYLGLEKTYIAVNLAGDMPEIRFANAYDKFINSMADFFCWIYGEKLVGEIVLVPHIFKDLDCINDVMDVLPDMIRRNFVTVAPLLHGMGSEKKIFSIYKNAELTIAMRFHANLCSLSLGTATVGLVSYIQIKKLYEELGLTDYLVDTSDDNFGHHLVKQVSTILCNHKLVRERVRTVSEQLKTQLTLNIKKIDQFLNERLPEI